LVNVVAFPTDRRLWTGFGFTPTWIRSSSAASDGSFVIRNMRAGEYHVVAVDSTEHHDWRNETFFQRAAKVSTPIIVRWGEAKSIDPVLVTR
jgi:hypothetical protein